MCFLYNGYIASLLPVVGVLAKSDRFTAFAKHTDELYEMRRVVRAGEKISELGTRLKNSWKQLERSAATAYNYIGDKIRYNSLMDVMDNLKQTTRPQLAVESYNNIFVEVFADSDSVMRQMAELPLSQKQKIFRETILESTDSAGNVTKESYEIATIAKEKTRVVREAFESGIKTVKELISESDAAKKWGVLDDGTNQGVKHFSDYWEKYPERLPSLEQRLGVQEGAFNNSL